MFDAVFFGEIAKLLRSELRAVVANEMLSNAESSKQVLKLLDSCFTHDA